MPSVNSKCKRKRTIQAFGSLNDEKFDNNGKPKRLSIKADLNNLRLKCMKNDRRITQATLQCSSKKNPRNEAFMKFRSEHRAAFQQFENSIGKQSGIPNFDETIRKSLARLKFKRTIYSSKCRCPKLRYKVLGHLINIERRENDRFTQFGPQNLC